MTVRSPLGRVLGRGSAKEGSHHWWMQRLSSVALVPLSLWFVISILVLPVHDRASVIAWMTGVWPTALMVLLVLIASWHSHLGVRVIIEDYVHAPGAKTLTLILSTFAHALLAVVLACAIVILSLGVAR